MGPLFAFPGACDAGSRLFGKTDREQAGRRWKGESGASPARAEEASAKACAEDDFGPLPDVAFMEAMEAISRHKR